MLIGLNINMRNSIDKKYTDLQQDILDNGVIKKDRTGTGTLSVFGRQIRHDMSEGFPLLTTKEVHFKSVVGELLWFLSGSTDIRYLWRLNIHIWDGDWWKANKHKFGVLTKKEAIQKLNNDPSYGVGFSDEDFDLGPIYGKQWRSWKTFIPYDITKDGCKVMTKIIDQFAVAIETLKTNPDSRRIMVNSWNVGDLDEMTLPPCHYGFQFWTRELTWEEFDVVVKQNVDEQTYKHYLEYSKKVQEFKNLVSEQEYEKAARVKSERDELERKKLGVIKSLPKRGISLMWNQRSVDTFLGLPFNIASYGLLLQIIAQHVNMVPLELIGNLGDTHLYLNHIDQAKEQISREGLELPTVEIAPFEKLEDLTFEHFELVDYKSHPRIKAPLSN